MTDGTGLKYREEEWEALATKWNRLPEEEQIALRSMMTRPQERRFDRRLARLTEDQRQFHTKLTTREDVIQIYLMFHERLRIVQRIEWLEQREAFRNLPWHRRARVAVLAWWTRVLLWLEARGIRLYKLEDDDGAHEDHADGGARGEEVDPTGQPAGGVTGRPGEARVPAGRDGDGVGERGDPEAGDPGGRAPIEVVSR